MTGPARTIGILGVVALSLGVFARAGGPSSRHEDYPKATDDAVSEELNKALIAGGTEAALLRLQTMTAENKGIERRAHRYVHDIGRLSYTRYGNAAEAFGLCAKSVDAGCYHGVLKGYFADQPDIATDDITKFCDGGVIDAKATGFLKFQCLHGLGHGLFIFLSGDLREALRYCDFLETDLDRRLCYGGVFMENIESVLSPHRGRHSPTVGHAWIKKDNPQYPCNSLPEDYKQECFRYQPMAILHYNGSDFDGAFKECEKAESVDACYMGVGAVIGAFTMWNPKESRALCMLGSPPYRVWCFEGVVKNLIGITRKTDAAFRFCRGAPNDAKGACFEAIVSVVPGLYTDTASMKKTCEKAEDAEWVVRCRRLVAASSRRSSP